MYRHTGDTLTEGQSKHTYKHTGDTDTDGQSKYMYKFTGGYRHTHTERQSKHICDPILQNR